MAAQALAPRYASRHALISTYATARAPLFRRTLGWFIDYLTVMIPGGVLVGLAAVTVVQGLPVYIEAVAGEVGWSNLLQLITPGGRGDHGPAELGGTAARERVVFALPLVGALLLVPLAQFLYLTVLIGWRGRTFGQMLVDTRVGRLSMDLSPLRRGRLVRWAFGTTLVETGLTAAGLVAVVVGQFRVGALILAVAVAAFWINALVVIGPRRRTIVERLCGAVLLRRRAHAPEPANLRVDALVEALEVAPVEPPVAPLVEAPGVALVRALAVATRPSPALTSSTGVYQTYQPREPTYPLRVRRSSSTNR